MSHRYACYKLIFVFNLSFDSCHQSFRLFLGKREEYKTLLKTLVFLYSVKSLRCKDFFKSNAYCSFFYLLSFSSSKEAKVSFF